MKRKPAFIGIWHLSNLLTLIGLCVAVCGIGAATHGQLRYALILLIVAGLIDLSDGSWASRFTRTEMQKRYGAQLDSLSDMISFIALPIVILVCMKMQDWLSIAILCLYAVCGLSRLAFFNITHEDTASQAPAASDRVSGSDVGARSGAETGVGSDVRTAPFRGEKSAKRRIYRGLPVTYTALILPLTILALESVKTFSGYEAFEIDLSGHAAPLQDTWIFTGLEPWLMRAVMLSTGIFFILDIPVRKPERIGIIVLALTALAMTVLALLL